LTIIAYRDGILAADTSTMIDGNVHLGRTKIARRATDGALIGSCGLSGFGDAFRRWALDGEIGAAPEVAKDSGGIIISAKGVVRIFDDACGCFELVPPYFAYGSGAPIALGAMFAGASAEEAVRAAIQHDRNCGGRVLALSHGSTVKRKASLKQVGI
jgi:ATP-dependent HslUV protease subunit HslV